MLFKNFRKSTKDEKLKIFEEKIKNLSKEETSTARENYIYLQSLNFEKHLTRLTKKLRGKSVVLYGAGAYLKTIAEFYDLSGLNIVSVSDKRFEISDNTEIEFLGYKTIKPDDIKKVNPDYVLVSTKFFINIIEDLMINILAGTKIQVKPLVKKSFFMLIKEIW